MLVLGDSEEVIVKNTFIHSVAPPASRPRSCSSVPPSLRLFIRSRGSAHAKDRSPAPAAADQGPPKPQPHGGGEDTSTDAGTSEGEQDVSPEARVSTEDFSPALSEASGTHSSSTPAGGSPMLNFTDEPRQSPQGGATHLNPRAKAWSPDMVTAQAPAPVVAPMQPPMPPASDNWFRGEIDAVVAAVTGALYDCTGVSLAEAVEGANGSKEISVRLHPQEVHGKGAVLACAKRTLTSAAEGSAHVYILGYKAHPFADTPNGFAALLGCVPDEQVACWQTLQQGICHYGSRCHWQHPVSQTRINVKVMIGAREHSKSTAF